MSYCPNYILCLMEFAYCVTLDLNITEKLSGMNMKMFEPLPQSKMKQSTEFMLFRSRGTGLI